MNDTDKILINLLAHCDGLWSPNRSNIAVVAERRREFIETGIPLAAKPLGDFDAALGGHRGLEKRLRDAGIGSFVECVGGGGGKVTCVRLSDAGDEHARAICGLPTLGNALEVAAKIHDLRLDPLGVDHNGFAWVAEAQLAKSDDRSIDRSSGDDDTGALAEQQVTLLPALWRGLVVSSSDVHRHTWYAVRPSRVSSYTKAKYPAVELPVASDEAWDEYVEAIKFARGGLQRAQGDLSEIGDVPFSARPTRRGSAAA